MMNDNHIHIGCLCTNGRAYTYIKYCYIFYCKSDQTDSLFLTLAYLLAIWRKLLHYICIQSDYDRVLCHACPCNHDDVMHGHAFLITHPLLGETPGLSVHLPPPHTHTELEMQGFHAVFVINLSNLLNVNALFLSHLPDSCVQVGLFANFSKTYSVEPVLFHIIFFLFGVGSFHYHLTEIVEPTCMRYNSTKYLV